MEPRTLHDKCTYLDVPLETWYSLIIAAQVDRAWDREPGRLCQLLEGLFGETGDASAAH